MSKFQFLFKCILCSTLLLTTTQIFAQDSVSGLYNAVLLHEGSPYYQNAKITLRASNNGDGLKISANVRLYFGKTTSNEFLTYDFTDVPFNLLTRQITFKSDANDVSFVGYLKDQKIDGEWYSSIAGRVGLFEAQKDQTPSTPTDGILVRSMSGFYKGKFENTGSTPSLPEKITISFVTTQNNSNEGPQVVISGKIRFYLGDFDSTEYEEAKFVDIQFNFYSRYFTAKTEKYGLTLKGELDQNGSITGVIFSDSLSEMGLIELEQM